MAPQVHADVKIKKKNGKIFCYNDLVILLMVKIMYPNK